MSITEKRIFYALECSLEQWRLSLKQAPGETELRCSSLPPIFETSCWHRDRPRPIPSALLAASLSDLLKALNSLFLTSSAIPLP